MSDPIHVVPAPRATPRTSGLAAVAEYVGSNDRIALGGDLAYVETTPLSIRDDIKLCFPSNDTEQAEKTRDGFDTFVSPIQPFGLYSGVECFIGGDEDFEALARTYLEQNWERGVEVKLGQFLGTLTPGVSLSLVEAIAQAEASGANPSSAIYGEHILYMSTVDAIRADVEGISFKRDGDILRLDVTGTPVIVSAAFPSGRIGISGAIAIHRSEFETTRVFDFKVNRELAIAEAVFGIVFQRGLFQAIGITS